MNYLVDTNVISELVRPKPSANVVQWFDTIPSERIYVSVLTLGEIRKELEKLAKTERHIKLTIWLEVDLPHWFKDRILSIDTSVAHRWGLLQAQMKRPLPAIDSLIAATALHHDLTLVTRNLKDFQYPFLSLMDPWDY